MTHGMGINGGDFVLTLLAEAMRDDYEVHIISSTDGPLRKKILSLGCVVVTDEYLLMTTLSESEWISAYDLVFVNGAIFHSLFTGDLSALKTPVVWWIHSSVSMNSEIMLQSVEGRTSQGRVSV